MKRILSSEFNRNILKLMTGSTMAQAIPIAISPILTRLYSPEDFGVFSLFIAITAIFGSIATFRYELAIVLPVKEKDSINIVALSVMISLFISTVLFLIVILFHEKLLVLLGNEQISFWLYFAPLTVLFIGIYNALNYYNTRLKEFGLIAQVKVIKSITLSIPQLLLGLVKVGVGGLISGQIISHVFTNGRLAKSLLQNKKALKEINFKNMIKQARRYKKFPQFTMWATLASTVSKSSVNIFLSSIYNATVLGHYSLMQRVLDTPTTLIGNSLGQVYFEAASKEIQKTGRAIKTFGMIFKRSFFIGIIMYGTLFLIGEELVSFVFGEEWRETGYYLKLLIPLMFLRFIGSPLTLTSILFEKQNIDFYWQIGLLLWSIIIFLITWIIGLGVSEFFILFSTIISIHYIIIITISYLLSKNGSVKFPR